MIKLSLPNIISIYVVVKNVDSNIIGNFFTCHIIIFYEKNQQNTKPLDFEHLESHCKKVIVWNLHKFYLIFKFEKKKLESKIMENIKDLSSKYFLTKLHIFSSFFIFHIRNFHKMPWWLERKYWSVLKSTKEKASKLVISTAEIIWFQTKILIEWKWALKLIQLTNDTI